MKEKMMTIFSRDCPKSNQQPGINLLGLFYGTIMQILKKSKNLRFY